MKNYIIVIAVIIIFILLLRKRKNDNNTLPDSGEPFLQLGDSGNDVFRLNEKLYSLISEALNYNAYGTIPNIEGGPVIIDNSWLNTYVVSGNFGPNTQAALMALTGKSWIYIKDIEYLKLPSI